MKNQCIYHPQITNVLFVRNQPYLPQKGTERNVCEHLANKYKLGTLSSTNILDLLDRSSTSMNLPDTPIHAYQSHECTSRVHS